MYLKRVSQNKLYDMGDVAALGTWACVFGLCVYLMPKLPEHRQVAEFIYIPLFLLYAACFVWATREDGVWGVTPKLRFGALMLMLASAFTIGYLIYFDFLSILTIIWVVVIAFYIPINFAIVTTLLVVVLWFAMVSFRQGDVLWIHAILYGTFHMFALLIATSNKNERDAKLELQAKHDQLVATQDLLTQVSRQTERTRIARDLHDLLGHHLTALTIKLQVAERVSEGEAKEQVKECHSIAKLLLNDVRDAVDTLRQSQSIDFRQSLELLLKNTPHLKVQLEFDDSLLIENIPTAQTLFRCIQEAVTNSLKHGKSNYIWIKINKQKSEIIAHIHDDGVVKSNWKEGNGLTGMKERVIEQGGKIDLSVEGHALHYHIVLPA